MNQDTLRDQSREKASIAYATCLRSLERTMRRLGIPMPQCANVSSIFRNFPTHYVILTAY